MYDYDYKISIISGYRYIRFSYDYPIREKIDKETEKQAISLSLPCNNHKL
jgi:hypothetical protein